MNTFKKQSQYKYFRGMQTYPRPVSRVAAIGVEIPVNFVSNEDIAEMVETTPALKKKLPKLIYRATKCKTRVYSAPGTSPSDLALAAARKAIDHAGITVDDIDTLIFASTDMDVLEPATANILQFKLGMKRVNAFDVTNACNSMLQAINIANSLIATGAAGKVLIASGEVGSYVCNRQLSDLRELSYKMGGLTLGDAGAAMILERSDSSSGFLEINLLSIGEHWDFCHVPELTDWRQRQNGSIHGWFYLDMPKLATVAKHETKNYFKEYNKFREETNGEHTFLNNLQFVIPHQISRKFIEDITDSFSFDLAKTVITADIFGNTASTSTVLAMQTLIDRDQIKIGSGQEILLYGAASGFGIGHIRLKL